MPKILVSACLYGECTKYDGTNNILKNPFFLRWKNRGELIPVCPEVMGGLPTPRPCSEICGGKVINTLGEDVTEAFNKGAREALDIAKNNNVTFAILKQGSPSCGCKKIHDGTFSGNKISGMGVTARLLTDNGIVVFDEDDIALANLLYTHAGKKHTHH
ncbi:MAG: DUF523 domain-containing protein [Clostridia bacterium]|nr:DUF523 domain-containing protein [Clostridia bacterium]